MEQITEPNKEQEEQIDVYYEKWLEIGRDTEQCDGSKAFELIDGCYEKAGLAPPKIKMWCPSPLAAARAYAATKLANDLREKDSCGCSDEEGDIAIVRYISSYGKVDYPAGDKADIDEEKVNALVNRMKENIDEDKLSENLPAATSNFCYGNHDAHWLGFYEYFLEVREAEFCEELRPMIEIAKVCGWFLPYEDIVFFSPKPKELYLENDNLHRDLGPALCYGDGQSLYCLNGVIVPKEIVMTPAEELDPGLALKEENAEVRAQIVQKIGMERIAELLDREVIDSDDDGYELWKIEFEGIDMRYLKMVNPSTGTIHVEGAPPGTETVAEALRAQLPEWAREIPVDDANGEDWVQTGDWVFVPEGAKAIKSRPYILT